MSFIEEKIHLHSLNSTLGKALEKTWALVLEKTLNPLFASIFFHTLLFAIIFGTFFREKSKNYVEFVPVSLTVENFTNNVQAKHKVSEKKIEKSEIEKINKQSELSKVAAKDNLAEQEQELSASSKNAKFANYVDLIANELDRRKSRFNLSMAPDNVKTSVVFKVRLDESGNLVAFEVVKNSGHSFFDKIAEKILTCKKTFPTPPKELGNSGLEFSIPIIFDSVA